MRRKAPGRLSGYSRCFEILGKPTRSKTCEAMQGLTSEMEQDLEEFAGSPAADAVLIGCAQAIEHYEIARYGCDAAPRVDEGVLSHSALNHPPFHSW
jgi:ferritin-like metal-binding protein YciE